MKLLLAALLGFLPGATSILSRPPAVVVRRTPAAPAVGDSTTVRLLYGAGNADLDELMGRELHIEKHRLELHDRRLAGRRLHLTLQEYRRGVAGPEKELVQEASLTRLDSAGLFRCTIYARATSDAQVETNFILPRAGIARSFAAVPGQAGYYSLRFDMHPSRRSPNQAGASPLSPATEFRLPVGPAAVLAVYTLPYEKDGFSYYCNLAQSRVPVAEWYAKFNIPHFVVCRVRVE